MDRVAVHVLFAIVVDELDTQLQNILYICFARLHKLLLQAEAVAALYRKAEMPHVLASCCLLPVIWYTAYPPLLRPLSSAHPVSLDCSCCGRCTENEEEEHQEEEEEEKEMRLA